MRTAEPLAVVSHGICERREPCPDGSTRWTYHGTLELVASEPAFEVLGLTAAAEHGFSFAEVPLGLVRVAGEHIRVEGLDLEPWGNRIPLVWSATMGREPPAWERWWAGC